MPTLDTPLQQCLVDFYDDQNYPWHHRVLLIRGPGLAWIWLTPDGEVQRADLSQSEWIGKQQQSEAAVTKAGRQWREETASLKKHEAGPGHKGKKRDE
jgi:hypothetical protein